jgi:hypothetical protein
MQCLTDQAKLFFVHLHCWCEHHRRKQRHPAVLLPTRAQPKRIYVHPDCFLPPAPCLQALDKARHTSENAAHRLSQISSEIGDDRPISGMAAFLTPGCRAYTVTKGNVLGICAARPTAHADCQTPHKQQRHRPAHALVCAGTGKYVLIAHLCVLVFPADLRFSADGSVMATCGWSGGVQLWTADADCRKVLGFR